MAFDIQAARKAGYTDDEIADFLGNQSKFDVAGARKAGYTAPEIVGFLSQAANDAKPDQGLTPLDTEQVTSARAWQGAGAGRGSPNDPRRVDVEQPKKASGLIGAELGQLRDEAFMGVQQSGAAVSNINAFAQANRLANTEQLIRDLETRGRGDSAAASRLRAEADSLRERLPATVGTAAEANADTQRASQMTMRPAIKKVSEAKTFGDAWEAFKEAPYDVIAGVTAQSLPQVLPGLIAAAVTGPAAGAAAMGLNSGVVEFGSSLTDFAQDKGIDTRSAKAVQNFYADPANLSDALKYAGTRAGIIGTMDAASGGIAGKTLAPAMRSPIKRQAVNMPAQMAVQGAAGGGGEAAAQLATKGEIDQPGQVFLEVAGELGGAPAEVAAFTREVAGSPQDQAARALAADLESGQLPAAQVETLNPNLAIQRKTQEGLINIGAAQTVDDAIAAATQATAPQNKAVDNIARLLGETPDVSQPGNIPAVDSGSSGLGAPEPAIGMDTGVGVSGTAERALDAGSAGNQPDGGTVPLGDGGTTPALSPDIADTASRIRELEGAPTTEPGLPQSKPNQETRDEPASMWFGRRGDGYQTPEDASAALPSRQRVSPDLEWKVEQMPSGRYRLAGYDTQTQQPASFKVTLNPTGTATIIGNPDAIKAKLAEAGIDKVMSGADRVIVGTSQAQAAVQVLQPNQPQALANTAQPAINSVANDQNQPTREDGQTQAQRGEAPAPAGSDAPGTAAVPAPAGPATVEGGGLNHKETPPEPGIYKLANGAFAKFDDGMWTRGESDPKAAMRSQMFIPGNMKPADREVDQAWQFHSGFTRDAMGEPARLKPAKTPNPPTQAQAGTLAEAAGVGETIVSANSTENIDGVRAAKQSGKKLAYGQYGDGTVTVGPSLDAKTHITLQLAPAERKALNKANALDKLAESQDERQEANKAFEDALAPAIDRAISKAATDPGTTQVEGGGVEQPEPASGNQPSLEDLNSGKAFVDSTKAKIAKWVASGTNNGTRAMDRRWEREAVKRFIDDTIKPMLAGKQTGNRAAAKIAIGKAQTFDELAAAVEKFGPPVAPNPPTQAQAGTLAEGAGESRPAPVAAPTTAIAKTPKLFVQAGSQRFEVNSIQDAASKWADFRQQAAQNGGGASDVGNGVQIVDQDGKAVARISYNGRVWEPGADGKLLFEAGGAPAQTATVKDSLTPDPRLIPVSQRNVPKKEAKQNTSPEPAQKQPESGQVEANDQTPKQYHDARLRKMSDDTGTPLAEVREFYDTEGGRAESDRLWSVMVDKRARDGATLARQTLDKFYELNPTARLPETAFPNGYQRPDARKQEAIAKDAIRQDRREARAARAASEEQVGPYGRDLTPIAQGGKPFKSLEEAKAYRKKNTNNMVVKKVGKNQYVLQEASAKQIAAWAKAGKRLGIPQTGGEGPQHVHGFLIGKGGLNKKLMADAGFDRNHRIGNRTLFAGTGGMTAERATELLAEAGYLKAGASHSDMFALVRKSVQTPQYTSDGWEQLAQAEQSTRFEDHLAVEQEATPEADDFDALFPRGDDAYTPEEIALVPKSVREEYAALIEAAEAAGVDVDAILEDGARISENQTQEQFNEYVRQALTDAIADSRREADRRESAVQGRQDAERGGTEGSRQDAGGSGAQEGVGRAAAESAATRTRPSGTINFPNPITGPSGAKLTAYTWQWKPMEFVDARGEDRVARISDWDNSETNAETGREVVHQFVVEQNGESKTVSAESAIRALGYGTAAEAGTAKSAISAAKTLARLQMQLSEVAQAVEAYEADKAEVVLLTPPEISGPDEKGWYSMGDTRIRQLEKGPLRAERRRTLLDHWRDDRLSDRGWKGGSIEGGSLQRTQTELQDRIKRAAKKLDAINSAALTAPTPAQVLEQQDRANRAEELDQREQIQREAEGFQLQAQAPEQRKDNTGDMFGGPSVEDVERARNEQREADAVEQAARDAGSGQGGLFASEPTTGYTGQYETDLFGEPVSAPRGNTQATQPATARVRGDTQPPAAVRDTPTPEGDFYVNTVVGSEATRRLGAKLITSAGDAATATRYLYKSAVERFDGIVTDKRGKPLAVIGGFKGANTQTAVYPPTLLGEAVRIPGAAYVWFSHNHPSGTPTLSPADLALNETLTDAFKGSGIEPRGLLAVAGGGYGYVDASGNVGLGGDILDPSESTDVPVIERQLGEGRAMDSISSPAAATDIAKSYHKRSKGNGIILLDAQLRVAGWVPITGAMIRPLRGTGALNALYRSLSQSNASAAIIAHNGDLGERLQGYPQTTILNNIANAMARMDVRTLDVINVTAARPSLAETGVWNGSNKGAMFSRTPAWRSELRDQIAAIKMESSKEEGWRAYISGLATKGVKPDEIEWSGVTDWLKLQTGKVTKQQILDYLDGNGVQVQEVVLGAQSNAEADKAMEKWGIVVSRNPEDENQVAFLDRDNPDDLMTADELESAGYPIAAVRAAMEIESGGVAVGATGFPKYSQYTLPGGQNYREVLLTLPTPADDRMPAAKKIGDAMARLREEAAPGVDYMRTPEYQALQRQMRELNDAPDPRANAYQSSHWGGTLNVIAHIRLNDRVDSDGQRVLFVEEIQSDWGQDGKKKGFGGGAHKAGDKFTVMRNGEQRTVTALQATENGLTRVEDDAGTRFNVGSSEGVPLAPFVTSTDKWLSLALKRVITMAAQEGYDRVAFVNGEQSAERYDLSKQVELVRAAPLGDGKYNIAVFKERGQTPMLKEDGISIERIEDLIGKDMAKKIADAPAGKVSDFSGDGLKVGGEGMRAFYDKILPNTLKYVLKKVGGGSLETVSLGGKDMTPGFFPTEAAARAWLEANKPAEVAAVKYEPRYKQWSIRGENGSTLTLTPKQTGFTVTPEMRNKASNGLPMFRPGAESAGMPTAEAQAHVTSLTKKWKNGPPITVVATPADLPMEAPGDARGVYWKGQVWVVAGPHKDRADLSKTLAHEAIAHFGLKNILTDAEWRRFMANIQVAIKAGNKSLTAIRDNIRERYVDGDGKLYLTEQREADEIAAKVAELAVGPDGEFRPGFGFVKAVYAKIMQFLRDLGLDVNLTLAEVQGMLVLAQKNLEAGKRTVGQGDVVVAAGRATNEPMASRSDVVSRAKALGLPATGTTEQIARLVSIAEADPSTWSREDFKAIVPYLSIHQANGPDSAGNVNDIMRNGLKTGMVDSLGSMTRGEWTWARGLMGGEAYVFISGALKFAGKGNPRLAPGNKPLFHFTSKPGQDIYEAITDGAFGRSKDQTNTPEFKAWFGDSVVTDTGKAGGKPLKVYHGTKAEFDAFKRTSMGEFGPAIYLTDSPREAGEYGDGKGWGGPIGTRVLPVYVSIKNPYTKGVDAFWKEFGTGGSDAEGVAAAIAAGYDGIIAKRPDRYYDNDAREFVDRGGELTHYIAFRPEQIKSVFNRGSYDPADPNIMFSRGTTAAQEQEQPRRPNIALRAIGYQGMDDFSRAPAGDQTQTEAFKRWFKDSKVVDAEGKPLRVYHGTNADFSVFNTTGGSDKFANNKLGAFFAADPDMAQYGRVQMPVYLSIKNPYVAKLSEWAHWQNTASAAEVEAKRAQLIDGGHDGVTDGMGVYVAFHPEQIKSATGNRGTFDPADPNIMFSRGTTAAPGREGWDMPTETRLDKTIYELQDGGIDLKRVQEAIKKTGADLEERFDARLAETLYPGRVAKRSENFLKTEVRPLLQAMALLKVDMTELGDYLIARHAPERNAQIAKINPDLPDGGAGRNSEGTLMTDDAAVEYLEAIPADKLRALETLAAKVDAITAGTRNLWVSEGLETPETVRAMEQAYKHYVPLFKDEAEFSHPQGMGFSVRGGASKRAMGSTKEVTNVLAHVLMAREAAITRAEKNRVGMALYGLALSYPNPDFWTVIRPNMSNTAIAAELNAMGVDPEMMGEGMSSAPTIRVIDPVTNTVVNRPNPAYKNMDNAVMLKVGGEDRVIVFNQRNERAMRMAGNLKNLDGLTKLELANSILGKATRYIAAVNTQYNPVFGLVNIIRDVQGATLNLTTTAIKDKKRQVLRDIPAALSGIARDLRGDANRSEWSDLWEQYQEDGGQTGYREMFRAADDRAKAIEKELGAMDRSTPGKAAHAVLDLMDDFNTALENAVRLSAYKAALDTGLSRKEAARLGKELTVNFNRKGRAGRELSPMYAFMNAAIQGNARLFETLRGPAAGKIVAGGLMLGAAQALMLAAAGFDDDEIPEWVKARALIIPVDFSSKRYITIPIALGFNVIPNTGRVLTEIGLNGGKDAKAKAVSAIGEILGSLSPVGGGNIFTADGALKLIAPTVADPVIEIVANRNFAGSPIEREAMENDGRPGYQRARESTLRSASGQAYTGISRALNAMTMGTTWEAGAVSPSPEMVRYVARVFGGGLLGEIERVIDAGANIATGTETKSTRVPLTSRFYGEVDPAQVEQRRFFDAARKIQRIERSVKAAKKAGDDDEASRIEADNEIYQFAGQLDRVQSRLRKLNKQATETINNPAEIRDIDAARTDEMKALNDEVRAMEAERYGQTAGSRLRKVAAQP